MKKRKSSVLLWTNVILMMLGITVLYFASMFWIGSKEEYDDLVNDSYWSFFANRLLFNSLVGLVLIGFVGIVSWIVKKATNSETRLRGVLTIDFLIFVICSIVFIAFRMA